MKVQHEGIEQTVHRDLDVLQGLAQLVARLPEFACYRPVEMIAEFQKTLRRELDFGREERNLQQFAARFPRQRARANSTAFRRVLHLACPKRWSCWKASNWPSRIG